MKLKTYDERMSKKRPTKPTIYFSKYGLITLSTSFCERAGLKPGDCVLVHQDEDEPTDWYLSKAIEGFELRNATKNTNALCFNSQKVCYEFRDSMELNHNESHSFYMATEPNVVNKEHYYAILTSKS